MTEPPPPEDCLLRWYKCQAVLPADVDTERAVQSLQRYYHSAVVWKNLLILCGGVYEPRVGTRSMSDVWVLCLDSWKWRVQQTTGVPPDNNLYDHRAVLVYNYMFIFGGVAGGAVNKTYYLNLERWEWNLLECSSPPKPRFACSFWYHDRHLYTWGGGDSQLYRLPIHQLLYEAGDLPENFTWSVLQTTLPRISLPSVYHTTTKIDNKIYISGGAGSAMNMWILDLDTLVWRVVEAPAQSTKRYLHSACVFLHLIVIFAGRVQGSSLTDPTVKDDIYWAFDTVSENWIKPKLCSEDPMPWAVTAHCMAQIDSRRAVLSGGCIGNRLCPDPRIVYILSCGGVASLVELCIEKVRAQPHLHQLDRLPEELRVKVQ
jgi:hypothetical protein